MTSNAGSREMSSKSIGFSKSLKLSGGAKELERLFSPEFRNRLTETVTFANLTHEVMEKIVHKFIAEVEGIDEYLSEATSEDYDNLLVVSMGYVDVE